MTSKDFSCVVFDTETTDKINYVEDKSGKKRAIMPRVIQLGYIYYDTSDPKKTKIVDKLIDIDDSIEISEGAAKVHGISKDQIKRASPGKKLTMENALEHFLNDVERCDHVVAHNVDFDKNVLIHELKQLENEELKTRGLALFETFTKNSKWTCTMRDNIKVCKLQSEKQRNLDLYLKSKGDPPKNHYKFPKLSETYKHYFGYEPNGEALHDAIMDVVLCLRVFVKYIGGKDICGEHGKITDYIKKLTPESYDFENNCPLQENISSKSSPKSSSSKSPTKKGGKRRKKRKTKRKR